MIVMLPYHYHLLDVILFSVKLANLIGQERKTGLTFAPETGTQRLRDVINK
ncbi:unnamed protein product, partial [marine sediment metagenome]